MLGKTMIFINFIDDGELNSGSSVRPYQMKLAFEELGYEVLLLKGNSIKNKTQRAKNIEDIKQQIKNKKPMFCYIEPTTFPMKYSGDKKFIKYLYKLNIPISYFYRDAYFKFGKEIAFNGEKVKMFSKKNIKFYIFKILSKLEEGFLNKFIDKIYFPTETLASYFKFKTVGILPPGGKQIERNNISTTGNGKYAIYVGGISNLYNISMILEAFDKINEDRINIQLMLVCRQKEISNIDSKYINKEWLTIKHVNNEELYKLYKNASIAFLTFGTTKYTELALSVKIFEYMSYNIPMIGGDAKEVRKIFDKYKIGILVKNTNELIEQIKNLYFNKDLQNYYRNNIVNALEENLWITRAKKVEKDMASLRLYTERNKGE